MAVKKKKSSRTKKQVYVRPATGNSGIKAISTRRSESASSRCAKIITSVARGVGRKSISFSTYITRLERSALLTRGRVRWISPYSSMFVSFLPLIAYATSGLRLIRKKPKSTDGHSIERGLSKAHFRRKNWISLKIAISRNDSAYWISEMQYDGSIVRVRKTISGDSLYQFKTRENP
jgi:hypothetical protein